MATKSPTNNNMPKNTPPAVEKIPLDDERRRTDRVLLVDEDILTSNGLDESFGGTTGAVGIGVLN